jgi:hypothetical protein
MGTKMFIAGSFEEELAKGMEERLLANQSDKQFQYEQLGKAADFLNAAAEIFDSTGFTKEAEILTQMLESLADKKKA